jgi:hypothetical protein
MSKGASPRIDRPAVERSASFERELRLGERLAGLCPGNLSVGGFVRNPG